MAAAGRGSFRIFGEGRMHERPIGEVFLALGSQGVEVRYEDKEGYPPLILTTSGLPGGSLNISLSESSQYLSGLLLAAPLALAPMVIGVAGTRLCPGLTWP